MKRVPMLMLLIMAFVSFATMDSFADSSPPGVEISISYELPQGIEVNIESQDAQAWQCLQKNLLNTGEGRIAVYHCDLKCWPESDESINYNSNNIAWVNSVYKHVLYWPTESETSLYTKNPYEISTSASNRYRLPINMTEDKEVLSLFYNSKGDRYSARNEVI